MSEESKVYTNIAIYNMRMAGWLMYNGHPLLKLQNDPEGSGRKIFIFKDSPELKKCMQEYLGQKK